VRELENVLHRALALSGSELIDGSDLGLAEDDGAASVVPGPPERSPEPEPTTEAALPSDLQAYLDDVERQILLRALERHRYNRTAAGARLGLSLRQMRYRMARLGVDTGGQAPD
jgi:two-component system, NtrC family, response regulator PilR